jgi:putative acetyltransferase
MMIPIAIRPELVGDVKAIETLTVAAFLNAPHASHTEQRIVSELRRTGKLALSLVAEANGAIVGHVALSPVDISDGSPNWYGLGPISVAPLWQRQGVGSALMHEALRTLKERQAAGCVLLGEPEYYTRFGFRADSNLLLKGVPGEYFLALAFNSAPSRGTVTYHDAFNA